MSAIAKDPAAWLAEGTVITGHEIEAPLERDHGVERRYAVRSGDGPGTLSAARRPFVGRLERARFRRLAARRAKLEHPAVIRIRAVGAHGRHPLLITDPYPEYTLGDLLERETRLQPERVVTMFAPVAEALDLAHAQGLVHRALGADSLLLAGQDRLLLDTFGVLAGDFHPDSPIANARDLRYGPPEESVGEPLSPRGNVYSLAALIVHALTGRPPYTGDGPAMLYAHLNYDPPSVYERLPELGREIDGVVARGMAKQAAERPSSATELVWAVAAAVGSRLPAGASRAAPSAPPRLHLVAPPTQPAKAAPGRVESALRGRRAVAAVLVGAALACGALAALAIDPFGADTASDPAGRPAGAAAWTRLDDRRAPLRGELAAASTPQAQAEAASALGTLYQGAARTRQPRALAAAASDASAAYERLATAASLHDEVGYAEAARAVERAEGRLSLAASRH